ncbi:leucyl aminopeptidase [Sinisalibacter aestuarii]|uniref:Probable cytosol aminopeptidase n=1 Tax=Sinisalibacter aestuarii TaxID=2949426 RepID=A0ABQ5LUA8_9RHOB|nr:leucyl aminopeptidase [Sinisalibacter aestuarii]GKY87851.1 putative cytosol aminopeptidase [Sinisalibacter aestuarii]
MTDIFAPSFIPLDIDLIATAEGRVVVLAESGRMDKGARRINRLTRGALARLVESEAFAKLKPGEAMELAWPAGMLAEAVQVVRIDRKMDSAAARRVGGAIGKGLPGKDVLVLAGSLRHTPEIALGAMLRGYEYRAQKSGEAGKAPGGSLTFAVTNPEALKAREADLTAVAEGVFFARDLVNAPANVLTTQSFADQLEALGKLGVEVEVLEEDRLAALGMGALLGVGQGSASPSKVVVMNWKGGQAGAAPLALIGKGVVFDTGGISLKPAAGMEDMTMDMGGAGTVAGVMKTLALRNAPANVVGLVGLVENMPDGIAQRPGDVVTSMKGDTIEVINTDAEGRLVLADVLWYAQDTFAPAGLIDLATLTGAIVVSLGHENAGVFSNDDGFAKSFLKAAETEGEGAWRMPLGEAYDKLLKSRIADMKNVGGRPAGSITAAQFLQRFVREGTPWIHLDIAGVASRSDDGDLAPKGATGWFVRALDRLVRDSYEG